MPVLCAFRFEAFNAVLQLPITETCEILHNIQSVSQQMSRFEIGRSEVIGCFLTGASPLPLKPNGEGYWGENKGDDEKQPTKPMVLASEMGVFVAQNNCQGR
jgi:hypothetical protein